MIRGWSHVNQLNSVFFDKYSDLNFVHYESTFKSNIYFKRDVRSISKLSRKSWSRRRHLNNWIVYQNVFSNWSNDYLFFKQYSKFVFNYQLLKHSFLTYNFMVLKKSNNSYIKDIENFVSSSLINRLSNYFNKLNFKSYLFLKRLKNNQWFFISSFDKPSLIKSVNTINHSPFYHTSQSNYYPIELKNLKLDYITQILDTIFNMILLKNIEMYKILSLLFFLNIK